MDPPRLDQAVAQLPKITGAAATRDHPAERPPKIGQCPQHRAQIAAQQGIIMKPLDQCQSRLDRRSIGQRRGQIIGQLPCARPGDAAINRLDQTSAPPALA